MHSHLDALQVMPPASHATCKLSPVQLVCCLCGFPSPHENRMNEEDLIICIAIWTLYKLWRPLISDELREISIASRNKLRFTSLLGPIFKDFGNPNGLPNAILEAFFLMLFFNAFEHPILVEAPNQKTSNFPRRKQLFLQSGRFR